MKKIFAVMAVALSAITMMAQQPVITFSKTEHDFGKINEADGRVSTVFEFKNDGMAPLVLSNVRASCGCTTPRNKHSDCGLSTPKWLKTIVWNRLSYPFAMV